MRRDDYRATLIVMFGLAAATLTGFLRQAVVAHQLGVGHSADVYLVAFAVPEFVFIALPTIFSPAFIPLFAECRLKAGETCAWRFGLRVVGAVLAVLLLLTALAGVGAPLYLRWLAPGFGTHERAQALRATRLMLPAISLMGLATLAGAGLQVYRRFARPASATAVYNLVFIVTLLAAPVAWPVGRAAWGVSLGAAGALLLQLPLLWKHRPESLAPEDATDCQSLKSLKEFAYLAGPVAAGCAVHHVILFVDRAMATALGAGSAAALNYAYHLALVVGQLSGLAVSTALFPRLAEQVADGDAAGTRAALRAALRFVWMVGLPATCGLIVLRAPLVRTLFERGAFDQAATAAVSGPLAWYGMAVLADALCQPLWRIVYARRSAWTVFAVNGLQTGVRLLANVALIPALGYNGLALSAALGLAVQAIVLGVLVRRRLGAYLTGAWWCDVAIVALAAVVGALVARVLTARLSAAPAPVALLVSGTLGGIAYLAALWSLRQRRGVYREIETDNG